MLSLASIFIHQLFEIIIKRIWYKFKLFTSNLVGVIINSLDPRKFEWNFRYAIFKWVLVTDGWGISCEITLIWISLGFTGDQSTLFQVMAKCHQATSHYLSQCWPRSLSPYGVTRLQWVYIFIFIHSIKMITKVSCSTNSYFLVSDLQRDVLKVS